MVKVQNKEVLGASAFPCKAKEDEQSNSLTLNRDESRYILLSVNQQRQAEKFSVESQNFQNVFAKDRTLPQGECDSDWACDSDQGKCDSDVGCDSDCDVV